MSEEKEVEPQGTTEPPKVEQPKTVAVAVVDENEVVGGTEQDFLPRLVDHE